MEAPLWLWITFNAIVLAILAVDLGVFNRKPHAVSMREAGIATSIFVSLSMAFAAFVWMRMGATKGMEFLTGYIVEYSLSADNIFVFVLLFRFFAVPPAYQHRVLFWGILAAVILRGAMIALGVAIIERFEWVLYLFGAFLVYTGIKIFSHKNEEIHPEQNPAIRFFRRVLPVTPEYHGAKFVVRVDGKRMFTPLFIVLLGVEFTDVVFAVDSIPAIFGITRDPFIVYTSNICAILGLRSLYFLLAGMMDLFIHLQTGLAIILTFVGIKMLIVHYVHIPTAASLGFIVLVLATSVIASLLHRKKAAGETPP
jgi:tellurite resistance protein TerC